nr:pheromone-processing carboxypeptidase KEX1 [Tanacetum cinerariifolium]
MKIGRVPTLLSFLAKSAVIICFSGHYKKLGILYSISSCEWKRSYILLMFWALCFLILAIYLRGSSKRSSDNEGCQYHSSSCLSELELYPSSYKVDQGILKDTYSLSNFIVVEDDEHEFIPRVVHLELIEGANDDGHEDCKNVIPSFLHIKLIEGGIGSDDEYEDSQGYNNGYDEDNDDDGDEDDVDSVTGNFNDKDDLTFRIEEFIAKNNNLWKEERLNDKLLYLEY